MTKVSSALAGRKVKISQGIEENTNSQETQVIGCKVMALKNYSL